MEAKVMGEKNGNRNKKRNYERANSAEQRIFFDEINWNDKGGAE